MKQRNPVTAALLSFFIPFYTLYWLYAVARDLKQRSIKAPSFLLLIGPMLGFIPIILLATAANGGQAGDSAQTATNIVILLLGIVMVPLIIILPLIYYYKFCKAAETATSGQISGGLTFILMVVLAPVAVYLIQEKLNLAGQDAAATPTPFAPAPAAPAADQSQTPPTAPDQNPSRNTFTQ
jgi:hypothetical protein